MSGAIPDGFQAMLDMGATSVCRCWQLVRRDGAVMGFTDHDRDLAFDGTVFQAGSGMTASAVESSTGLSVDNGQAMGALSAVGLTDADILAGRYDRAEVRQWLVDWQDPQSRVQVFRGNLGEIRRGSAAFEVELRSLSEALNQPVGRAYVPECDRILGDAKCGVDLGVAGRREAVEVLAVTSARRFAFTPIPAAQTGWFNRGHVRWLTGANAGMISLIKTDVSGVEARSIETWEELRSPVVAGDQAELLAGCDKRAQTCADKFDNLVNFRGFPSIPGEDWVSAYPAEGEEHNGGALDRA